MGPKESASGIRALRAIVIALLVGLLGLASVGFAGEPTTERVWTTTSDDVHFGVPSPHVGDKVRYHVAWDQPVNDGPKDEHGHTPHDASGHGGDGSGHGHLAKSSGGSTGDHGGHGHHENESTFAFEWLEPAEIYDRNGVHHYTNRLALETWAGASQTWFFTSILELDQASRDVVGASQSKNVGFGYSTGFGGSSETTTNATWTMVFDPERTDLHQRRVTCGVFHPLQGVQRNLSAPVSFGERCSTWFSFGEIPVTPGVYVVEGLGDEDGVRMVRLVRDPDASGDKTGVHKLVVSAYTFREDVPYPVVVDLSYPDLDQNATWKMTSFIRGDQPLGMSASTQPPLAPLAMVPVPEHGIDDQGVDHPYPLNAAWQDALVDARTGLRLFLDEHDDTYVSYAAFRQVERDAGLENDWTFVVTDGRDHLTVCQSRAAGPVAVIPAPPATSVEAHAPCPQFAPNQPETYQPALRPSAVSLQTAWKQIQGILDVEARPLAYGLTVADDGTDTPFEVYTIGTATQYGKEVEPLTATVAPYEVQEGGAEVRFSADGRLEAFTIHMDETRFGPPDDEGDGIPTSAPSRPASGMHAIERLVPAAVFAPSATEASAVGGMALGAAALYWLWPWLNQVLFAPLFSRIQKPKVLDHERRQRIAAAVAAEPGVHFEELRRRLDMGRGTLRHHLQMLVQTGVVGVRRANGYTCYYPTGEVDVRAVDAQAAARSPTAQQVLEAWQADPTASGTDLAERLGMSRQTVHYHQKRLRAAGLMT